MPDRSVDALLQQVRRRWRLRHGAHAVTVAGAAFTALLVLTSVAAGVAAAAVALVVVLVRQRAPSAVDAAGLIERSTGSLDNLLITAAELGERPRPVAPEIFAEVQRQATSKAAAVDARRVVPLVQPFALAAAVVTGSVILASAGLGSVSSMPDAPAPAPDGAGGRATLVVRVTPPAYTGRAAETLENPLQVSVIAGSRVEIDADGQRIRAWTATEPEAIELRPGGQPRLLSVMVVPDAAPLVRVVTPGRDTAFAAPAGRVAIVIESRDDFGLASLALRYTKASGGGESVAFTDGEIPLRVERASAQQWRAQATLVLEGLQLADGDIVVYHAVARDTNPAGRPVPSEHYLIEIGKSAEIADAGFSLPSEDKKYAISQQMVIYKTEQLIARLRKGAPGLSRLEEGRSLGVEQRMVRAEVVFLGGGDVQDEVEEAAHSHELAEGRLENRGRAEMLRAINAMSRAEAQLNDGRLEAALIFEREALAALERALDRRRYFMRTMPDRSRIDTARRLTGERREARSWTREQRRPGEAGSLESARRVMRSLAAAAAAGTADAALAARVAALDPASRTLQAAAVALASASTDRQRAEAVGSAMRAVTAHALERLPGSAAITVAEAALVGALADELARRVPR